MKQVHYDPTILMVKRNTNSETYRPFDFSAHLNYLLMRWDFSLNIPNTCMWNGTFVTFDTCTNVLFSSIVMMCKVKVKFVTTISLSNTIVCLGDLQNTLLDHKLPRNDQKINNTGIYYQESRCNSGKVSLFSSQR